MDESVLSDVLSMRWLRLNDAYYRHRQYNTSKSSDVYFFINNEDKKCYSRYTDSFRNRTFFNSIHNISEIEYDINMCTMTPREFEQNERIFIQSQTPENCLVAVRNCGNALRLIRPEFMSYELCLNAVKHGIMVLCFVPMMWRTKELCFAAICHDPFSINDVPMELQTIKMCKEAIKRNSIIVTYIDCCDRCLCGDKYQSLCKYHRFKHIPKCLWIYAIQRNPMVLKWCIYGQNNSICLFAVKKNGLALQHVIGRTEHICRVAVMQNIKAIKFVSNRLLQIMLCKEMIQKNPSIILYVKNPPEELVIIALRLDWKLVFSLNSKCILTKKCFIEIAKQQPSFFRSADFDSLEYYTFADLVDDDDNDEFFTSFLRGIYDQFTR